jgi:hypothetical protein
VVLPVLVFLVVSELARSPSARFLPDRSATAQAIGFLAQPAVLAAAAGAFVLKMTSVFFSNADMYLAYDATPSRYGVIARRIGLRWLLIFLAAAAVWTAVFCAIAIGVSFLAEATLPRVPAFGLIGLVGAVLFPVYYIGVSLGSLIAIARRLHNLHVLEVVSRAWSNRLQIYSYYAVRSIVDSFIAIGIPIALAAMILSKPLGVTLTIILVTIGVAIVRASFMAYKRDIILGPRSRVEGSCSSGTIL